jgi:hypothetical protein
VIFHNASAMAGQPGFFDVGDRLKAAALATTGAQVLRAVQSAADAVIHTAFNHDFFKVQIFRRTERGGRASLATRASGSKLARNKAPR